MPGREQAPRTPGWKWLRRLAQGLVLLLFVAVLVYANAQGSRRFWADMFARLDPLLMLSASLAGRAFAGGALLAIPILALTLLFGRVWCGWLCPLGTVLAAVDPWSARRPGKAPSERWRAAKYLLLLAILVAALLGSQALTWLDPITVLSRTLTTAAWPAVRYGVVRSEALLYRFPVLWPALDAVHGAVIQPLFQEVQPVFTAGVAVALFFAGLVVLNRWARRFWCRYLCPLGGLLGLLARFSLLRREVSGECIACGRCAQRCPSGTIDPQDAYRSDPAECLVCLECVTECPRQGVSFRWQLPGYRAARRHAYDPSRRQALAVAGGVVAGLALAGVQPVSKRRPVDLLRPPGADEVAFSALCVRCGACVRVCPTQGLQPGLLEAGFHNLLVPRLVPRLGPCSFSCHACGQVCPTGAIPRLSLAEKQATTLGLARIDRDRCLPWAYDTPCIVCEEACPIADKAIVLEEVEVRDGRGEALLLQRPRVIQERCIGCGICEYQCPLGGEAAVRVYTLAR